MKTAGFPGAASPPSEELVLKHDPGGDAASGRHEHCPEIGAHRRRAAPVSRRGRAHGKRGAANCGAAARRTLSRARSKCRAPLLDSSMLNDAAGYRGQWKAAAPRASCLDVSRRSDESADGDDDETAPRRGASWGPAARKQHATSRGIYVPVDALLQRTASEILYVTFCRFW
jgi:hypothetical protein